MAHAVSTFRAYRIEAGEGGRPEGRMTTIALSDLNEGELIVRVAYSNLNYKDALAATGAGKIARRMPIVGGIDVAGVVESSEDRDGGYAEYARLKADHALPLPRGLDAEEAMALGTAGLTAALSVMRMEHNGLSPDKGPVAVTGASGGVGSLAVDMLAGMGYEVTAITGKAEERGRLERLGAGEVLARQELEMGGRPLESARWAGAVDIVGGEMLGWLTRTAKKDGRIAVCGNAGGPELATTVFPFILRGVDLLGIDSDWCDLETRRVLWDRMARGGDLNPIHLEEISRSVTFDELPDVFGAFLEGGPGGRTTVRVGG